MAHFKNIYQRKFRNMEPVDGRLLSDGLDLERE